MISIKKSLLAGGIVGALMFGIVVSFAKASPQSQNFNLSQCNSKGKMVVNVTFKITNDADSGVAGNAWANDNYNKHIKVWSNNDGGYCAEVKYEGQFVTYKGFSPQNTGKVGSGIKGTFNGGYTANIEGRFDPLLKTNGNLGPFNWACDESFNCSGYFDWVSAYFPGYTYFSQPYWSWTYHGGKNGIWVNASTGNSGDIKEN